jgi:predicted amidohydrolase YtcJ
MRPLGRIGLLCAVVLFAAPVCAQPADTVLLNGKLVTLDAARPRAEAIAIRDGRILAVGRSADIEGLAGPATRRIDLAGRTVIPGLIDSHIHAIRAGLTFATEVHWIGAGSLAEALGRITAAARNAPKGAWLVVAGGWTERQFREGRRPTQAEIAAAAPDHPVYVQILYSAVLLSPGGDEALGLAAHPDLVARLKVETASDGRPTGWLSGDNRAVSDLFNLLPRPSFEQQVAGTRAFFRTLNSLGVTGVLDPGGYNMPIEEYRPLFHLWRERGLTVRVAYNLCAPRRDHELEDLQALTAAMPMGFGDDWLRFNGIGENVTWGMYNNDTPSEAQRAQLLRVLRWAAPRGLSATFHWHNDRSVDVLLDVLEEVNRETPVAKLRWSVAHLNDASPQSLARIKALGMGWLVQNALYFRGEAFIGQRGLDVARLSPPIATALRMNVPVGGGTDAHRVMSYNPFVALQWMLDGRTVSGTPIRGPEEIPSREDALRIYTLGSAWFAHDDHRRGSLSVGKLADLAVLDADYLTMPVEDIGGLVSLFTMTGGRVVYATGDYAGLADR